MSQSKAIVIGLIGGSGLDEPDILSKKRVVTLKTPFGNPSDRLVRGEIRQKKVILLARHGRKHSLIPSLVPYRANIWALKKLGCTHLLATTACGSLKESLQPGDLVFLDQFIDFTKLRPTTFFERKVVHTPMAQPFDAGLRKLLIKSAKKLKIRFHPSGTVITIEGPRFSSRAESLMFKQLGADVINMSTVPEVTLANELGLPYQSIAMVTDYDCWKKNEDPVSFPLILKRMNKNSERVKRLILKAIDSLN